MDLEDSSHTNGSDSKADPGGKRGSAFSPQAHGACPIYTVAAYKGGMGKTTLAYEIAYLLDAVLIDLDWDKGNASRKWGYIAENRTTVPLLESLHKEQIPRPLKGKLKPDLVPGHPSLPAHEPDPHTLAKALQRWAEHWQRPVVIDTHPGGQPWTYGAMSAADVVVAPIILGELEMNGQEGLVEDAADYPLLLIPNQIARVPNARLLNRLGHLAKTFDVPVGPAISYASPLPTRSRRMAVTASHPVPKKLTDFVNQITRVVKTVTEYGN